MATTLTKEDFIEILNKTLDNRFEAFTITLQHEFNDIRSEITTQVSELRDHMNARFTQVDQRIDNTILSYTPLEDAHHRLERRVTKLEGRKINDGK